jgi:hypothetical protein
MEIMEQALTTSAAKAITAATDSLTQIIEG